MAVSTRTNTRRSGRSPAHLQITLLLESQRRKIGQKIGTVDISATGARIRSCGALVPGQMVMLIPNQPPRNVYFYRVVWVNPVGPQLYSEAGLEFGRLAPT